MQCNIMLGLYLPCYASSSSGVESILSITMQSIDMMKWKTVTVNEMALLLQQSQIKSDDEVERRHLDGFSSRLQLSDHDYSSHDPAARLFHGLSLWLLPTCPQQTSGSDLKQYLAKMFLQVWRKTLYVHKYLMPRLFTLADGGRSKWLHHDDHVTFGWPATRGVVQLEANNGMFLDKQRFPVVRWGANGCFY